MKTKFILAATLVLVTILVAGGEIAGKKVFGLFFNGFYLPHELGHGL